VTVFLTGDGGQLGGALALGLTGMGPVVSTDRDRLDLTDLAALRDQLDRLRPKLIVNAAAYTDVEKAEDDRTAAWAINARVPAALAAWAASNDAALVHYSTDYVYDGSGSKPREEDARPSPLNAYGESKVAGDEAVLRSGAAALILRTSWLYADKGRNFLLTMLRLGNDRRTLQVVDDQIGAPTSAPLLAQITLGILAQSGGDPVALFRRYGGVVHAAASGETSWHGFAEAIFRGARVRGVDLAVEQVIPVPSGRYPTRATRPLNSRLSLERLRQRFGIVPSTWEDALADVLDMLVSRKADSDIAVAVPNARLS